MSEPDEIPMKNRKNKSASNHQEIRMLRQVLSTPFSKKTQKNPTLPAIPHFGQPFLEETSS